MLEYRAAVVATAVSAGVTLVVVVLLEVVLLEVVLVAVLVVAVVSVAQAHPHCDVLHQLLILRQNGTKTMTVSFEVKVIGPKNRDQTLARPMV